MAVVVSHIASDFEALTRQALRQAPLADLIELRLDRIGDPGEEALRAFIQASPKPVIVTVHGPEAFGDFAGSIDERLEILRTAARAGAAFVDVDYRLSLELGEVAGKCHRIVSRHETEGTPEGLEALHEEIVEVLYEGDVTKLVTHADTAEDGLRVMRYLRERGKGLIAFCSGEAGAFTRIVAPIIGSPFTYAAPADLPGMGSPEPTAPGQWRVNDLLGLAPPGGLSPGTAIFGVIGRPIAQSFSPRVHGMALKAARLDAVYLAFEPESIEDFLTLADDENFRGFSVTAPFKIGALGRSSSTDQAARATGAANTLVRERLGWRAFNTDVGAVRDALRSAFQLHGRQDGRVSELDGARVLILGAGGAARAAAQAVREGGGQFVMAGRNAQAAQAVASELGGEARAWDERTAVEADALLNATPLGSLAAPGECPYPAEALKPAQLVMDAVYRPIKTPLLAAAVARGCTAVPGAEWFVRQAMAQFRLFTNVDPDEAMMRAAFEHALADPE